MSRGERVLDQTYLFAGVHYCPGPGGFGVVDKNGDPIDIPKDFPKEKLAGAAARIKVLEEIPFRSVNRIPSADSELADGHRGKQPQDDELRFGGQDGDATVDDEDDSDDGDSEKADYAAMTTEELSAMCDERGVTVKSTGSGGKHLKKDFIKALQKADKEG